MSKVCYLLGAGASYGKRKDPENITMDDVSLIEEGLPIVSEINEELEYVIGWVNSVELTGGDYTLRGETIEVDGLKNELIIGFEWLLKESSRHSTIDTFAKKLFLKGDNDNYGRLKFLLSSFFLIEQLLHPYDKRYDAFLANILNSQLRIPDEIFIMTWNYDVQFDIAYRDYNELGLPMCVPQETSNSNINARLFKINGSANYFSSNYLDSSILLQDNSCLLLERILKQLSMTTGRGSYSTGTTDLLFAWEKAKYDEISKILYQNISDAQVLVIIGYTFPFFNREIDREIFSNMPKLEKLYVQDPNADKVKIALKSILPSEKYANLFKDENLVYDTTNFFLPPEL